MRVGAQAWVAGVAVGGVAVGGVAVDLEMNCPKLKVIWRIWAALVGLIEMA